MSVKGMMELDSYMALWREYESLQEENLQLVEQLEALQSCLDACLDFLTMGQVEAAKALLQTKGEI